MSHSDGSIAELLPGEACLPEPWFGSAEEQEFSQRLQAAPKRILLLDYDGTLAPFHADKGKAVPYPGVNELLQELRTLSGVRIVLVTGREASDLPALMAVAKDVEVWGSHGREHVSLDGHYTLFAPTADQYAALDTLQREMDAALLQLGLRTEQSSTGKPAALESIERKPASVAVHWRGLDAESGRRLEEAAETVFRTVVSDGIEMLPFAAGLEFRATGYTKAFAVREVLREAGQDDAVAYLGDDLTDEDAFEELRGRGATLLVRAELRMSKAQFSLCPPEELLRFLESWNRRDRPVLLQHTK